MAVNTKEKETKKEITEIEKMAETGMHFGQDVSKRHPNMIPYIEGVKGSVHIIDLNKTKEKLDECLEYIKELKKEDKVILFISTKPELKKIVKDFADECRVPYVINRFLGGMITNFNTIKKRIDYYNDILKQMESGELERKYTKHERMKIAKEMEGLEKKFAGVKNMNKIPDAIFLIDMVKDDLAIKEAKRTNIPVIAIADTNCDPKKVDYFIPGNDNSIYAVKYILEEIKKILKK